MELRRVLVLVGLGAFILIDVALIVWALHPTPAKVVESASTAEASTSPVPSDTASPSASASPSPTPSRPVLEPVPLTRIVAATGGSAAWVADSGTCDSPGTVLVTTDRGASWSANDAPGQVLRIRPSSATAAFVTGGDSSCDLRLWSTGDGGGSWGNAQSASQAWSRMPDDARSVHTPNGKTTKPCPDGADVVDLTTVDAGSALVLCDSGKVLATGDGGSSWSATFTVEGGLALALAPDGSAGVVATADKGCEGVVAIAIRNGSPAADGTCVKSSPRSGQVAVASSGSRWWLVSGDEVFTATSPDGPWSKVKGSLAS